MLHKRLNKRCPTLYSSIAVATTAHVVRVSAESLADIWSEILKCRSSRRAKLLFLLRRSFIIMIVVQRTAQRRSRDSQTGLYQNWQWATDVDVDHHRIFCPDRVEPNMQLLGRSVGRSATLARGPGYDITLFGQRSEEKRFFICQLIACTGATAAISNEALKKYR